MNMKMTVRIALEMLDSAVLCALLEAMGFTHICVLQIDENDITYETPLKSPML